MSDDREWRAVGRVEGTQDGYATRLGVGHTSKCEVWTVGQLPTPDTTYQRLNFGPGLP